MSRPPPPPPPRPERSEGSSPSIQSNQSLQHQQHQQRDNHSNNSLSSIRHPSSSMSTITIRSATTPGDSIKLLITPEMTHNDLAHCIAHAALSPPQTMKLLETWSMDEGEANWTRIAGLFRESDGVFIPISLILQSPEQYTEEIFRISRHLQRPMPTQSKRSEPIFGFKTILFIIIIGSMSALLMTMDVEIDFILGYIDVIITGILNLPSLLVKTIINDPLKELYRHGPSVIGWEGSSLPSICTQITHMGDENFWYKNIDECEKIYANKEMAMLHVRKPILYIVIALSIFFAVQSLMKTWAIQRQNRPPKEMIETYEAFRLVMKIIRRGMTPHRTNNYQQ